LILKTEPLSDGCLKIEAFQDSSGPNPLDSNKSRPYFEKKPGLHRGNPPSMGSNLSKYTKGRIFV
jgi:hypothetical protein